MYLLDTNHCSRILEGDAQVLQELANNADVKVATSVITRGELIYMVQRSQQREANASRVENLLSNLDILPLDAETATIYGHVKALLFHIFGPKDPKKRRSVTVAQLGFGENDLWIAALTVQHGLTSVSSDSDFQRIQQAQTLNVTSWWIPPKANGVS